MFTPSLSFTSILCVRHRRRHRQFHLADAGRGSGGLPLRPPAAPAPPPQVLHSSQRGGKQERGTANYSDHCQC